MSNCCKECTFSAEDAGTLYCRRYPPTLKLVPQPVVSPIMSKDPPRMQLAPTGIFPPVRPDWYCGDFQSKVTN